MWFVAALFFTTYESVKGAMGFIGPSSQLNLPSLVAASCCGETVCKFKKALTEFKLLIFMLYSWLSIVHHCALSNNISRLIYSVCHFEHITTPYFMTV